MSVSVECQSEFMVDMPGDPVFSHEVASWLADLPNGASLVAVMRDLGSQRDPAPTLIGLRASWSEVR